MADIDQDKKTHTQPQSGSCEQLSSPMQPSNRATETEVHQGFEQRRARQCASAADEN
jgi:hypothetical protein